MFISFFASYFWQIWCIYVFALKFSGEVILAFYNLSHIRSHCFFPFLKHVMCMPLSYLRHERIEKMEHHQMFHCQRWKFYFSFSLISSLLTRFYFLLLNNQTIINIFYEVIKKQLSLDKFEYYIKVIKQTIKFGKWFS